ncbi:hypothetical protein ABKV19_002851 [Rosa sericea]
MASSSQKQTRVLFHSHLRGLVFNITETKVLHKSGVRHHLLKNTLNVSVAACKGGR